MSAMQLVIDGVQPPPAPTQADVAIGAVVEYIKSHRLWPDTPPEEAAKDILSEWHVGMDGYDLAKQLDMRYGWDITAADVEHLDGIDSVVHAAQSAARLEWAEKWNIQPPHPIGATIKIKYGRVLMISGVSKHAAATYEAVDPLVAGTTGTHYLVPFEDAKPVQQGGAA